MIIYDCEIEKAILGKFEMPAEGIAYCEGWRDFQGMGISCIGAYDYQEARYRVFCKDNFAEFQRLVDGTDLVIGFNNLAFDNRLCEANGITVPDEKSYDLLVEIWKGAGLEPLFEYPTHAGFGLDAICKANFGCEKSGHGALAPVQWQQGEIGVVIDYCLNDVRLTRMLFERVFIDENIRDPRDSSLVIQVAYPPNSTPVPKEATPIDVLE